MLVWPNCNNILTTLHALCHFIDVSGCLIPAILVTWMLHGHQFHICL